MIVKGKLINCKREEKTFGGRTTKEKLFITLAEVALTDKEKKECAAVFADSGKKFTPDWVKDFKGYVNVSTEFALPYRNKANKDYPEEGGSIEELIKSGFPWVGAEVSVSLNLKNSDNNNAIYPNSIIINTEGKAFNPFAEFDNMEED